MENVLEVPRVAVSLIEEVGVGSEMTIVDVAEAQIEAVEVDAVEAVRTNRAIPVAIPARPTIVIVVEKHLVKVQVMVTVLIEVIVKALLFRIMAVATTMEVAATSTGALPIKF